MTTPLTMPPTTAPARKPLNLKAAPKTAEPPRGDARPWTVLVVDDDPEVHDMTRLILAKLRFRERGLHILSAYSAEEARRLLEATPDVAVLLLDVVMETDDAGLRLARAVREELANDAVRIILRTGQPGQAPEEDVIVNYDINDYKAKTELTAQKLFTAVVTALRSYGHIRALDANRRGLERIIGSSSTLFRLHSMHEFATGVLTQLSAFLGCTPNGILCVRTGQEDRRELRILAGVGEFEGCLGCRFGGACGHWQTDDLIASALESRSTVFEAHHTVLYIDSREADGTVVLVHSQEPLTEVDRRLLELFASKIAIGFENVMLYGHMEELVGRRTRELERANADLERLATIDPLTGARNRRAFLAQAAAEAARAARHGHPLSVLVIDLDHFKRINDGYGHAAGDAVLRAFVERAAAALRAADVIGRLGGEEFAVLLPETGLAAAAEAAERIRAALAAGPVAVEGGAVSFTASIGVAELGPDGDTPEAALNHADRRLYQAKREGRNRTVATDPPALRDPPSAAVSENSALY